MVHETPSESWREALRESGFGNSASGNILTSGLTWVVQHLNTVPAVLDDLKGVWYRFRMPPSGSAAGSLGPYDYLADVNARGVVTMRFQLLDPR